MLYSRCHIFFTTDGEVAAELISRKIKSDIFDLDVGLYNVEKEATSRSTCSFEHQSNYVIKNFEVDVTIFIMTKTFTTVYLDSSRNEVWKIFLNNGNSKLLMGLHFDEAPKNFSFMNLIGYSLKVGSSEGLEIDQCMVELMSILIKNNIITLKAKEHRTLPIGIHMGKFGQAQNSQIQIQRKFQRSISDNQFHSLEQRGVPISKPLRSILKKTLSLDKSNLSLSEDSASGGTTPAQASSYTPMSPMWSEAPPPLPTSLPPTLTSRVNPKTVNILVDKNDAAVQTKSSLASPTQKTAIQKIEITGGCRDSDEINTDIRLRSVYRQIISMMSTSTSGVYTSTSLEAMPGVAQNDVMRDYPILLEYSHKYDLKNLQKEILSSSWGQKFQAAFFKSMNKVQNTELQIQSQFEVSKSTPVHKTGSKLDSNDNENTYAEMRSFRFSHWSPSPQALTPKTLPLANDDAPVYNNVNYNDDDMPPPLPPRQPHPRTIAQIVK